MSFSLIPDRVFEEITDIEASWLDKKGIRLLICDLDNTLASYSQHEPTDAVAKWSGGLHERGIELFVVSNNRSDRVKKYCEKFGVRYINRARKPGRTALVYAMKQMSRRPEETALVGDQIFTDVLGAKRSGILALLVRPISFRSSPLCALRYLIERPFRALGKRRGESDI